MSASAGDGPVPPPGEPGSHAVPAAGEGRRGARLARRAPRTDDRSESDGGHLPPPALVRALERTLAGRREVVLAVSGGLDSMALLYAVAAWRPASMAVTVATFDHGTGEAASRASALVRRAAHGLRLRVVAGVAATPASDEAGWRRDRWEFLHRVALDHVARGAGAPGAPVVTAHTRDDQVETVLQRLLRGSGPRGLAGLLAPSPVLRPWLAVTRATLAAWVAVARIPFVTDPSNESRAHQRNRLRLDLLPGLRRVWPGVDQYLLDLGRRSAGWRREVEGVVDLLEPWSHEHGGIAVARAALEGYSLGELAVAWPALAARAGVRLDRRGTRRLAAFTTSAGRTASMPLSGGAEAVAVPGAFLVRERWEPFVGDAELVGALDVGEFSFRVCDVPARGVAGSAGDPWLAALPLGTPIHVRPWRAGDRIRRAGSGTARRVKRYLAEAGIPGPLREGWPVVVAAGEIIWIPGVCRSVAATARPGRPEVLYRCDHIRR